MQKCQRAIAGIVFMALCAATAAHAQYSYSSVNVGVGVGGYQSTSPRAVEFDNKFWIFFDSGSSSTLHYITTTDPSGNGSFSATQSVTTAASNPEPMPVVFDGKIYLFYSEDGGLGRLIYRTKTATGSWSGESQVSGAFTNSRPGVTVFDNKLYVFWEVAGNDNQIGYRYMTTGGSSYGPYYVPQSKTTWAPTAATYNNQLYLVYTGQSGSTSKQLWYNALTLQGNWTGEAAVPGNPRSRYPIDTAVSGGQLHVLYTGATSFEVLRKRLNGASWSGEEWISPLGSTLGLGVAPFSNEMWGLDADNQSILYFVF